MRRLQLGLVLSSFFGLAACGSSGGGVSAAEAQSDCNIFVSSVYCPKIVSCEPTAIDQATCVAAAQTSINCANAKSENGQLATCEAQLGNDQCSVLITNGGATVTLPAACMGVFLF